MARIHSKLEPLPPVAMEPLRRLVVLIHQLECAAADEPVEEVEERAGGTESWSGMPISGAQLRLVNLHLAIKALANYRLADWDDDPLVIRRWSELHEAN